jgi:hypothetical protein
MIVHATDAGTLTRESTGWYMARCICGWRMGPLPDLETTVDTLMDHAWSVAWDEAVDHARMEKHGKSRD